MPVGERVIAGLLERGKERRRARKREEGLTEATNLLNIVQGDASVEEKRRAALGLQALGFPVNQDLLKPKIDYDLFFEQANTPKELRAVLKLGHQNNLLSGQEFFKSATRTGDSPKVTEKFIQAGIDMGAFKDEPNLVGLSAKQIKARIDFASGLKEATTADIANRLAGGLFGGDKKVKLTSAEEKTALLRSATTDEQGNRLALQDVLASPDRIEGLVANEMMPRLFALYGQIDPAKTKGVSATRQFMTAFQMYQDIVEPVQKTLGIAEESKARLDRREATTGELAEFSKKRQTELGEEIKSLQKQLEQLRFNQTDSMQVFIDRFSGLQIGGALNPADFLPAGADTDEMIRRLKAEIAQGITDPKTIVEEDFKRWEEAGFDSERIRRELGIE